MIKGPVEISYERGNGKINVLFHSNNPEKDDLCHLQPLVKDFYRHKGLMMNVIVQVNSYGLEGGSGTVHGWVDNRFGHTNKSIVSEIASYFLLKEIDVITEVLE